MVSSSPPSSSQRRLFWLAFLVAIGAMPWTLSGPAFAQSGRRSELTRQFEDQPSDGKRIYVEPIFAGASPFLPTTLQSARYPLALHGFSAIDLRDHQQWVLGRKEHQAVFDGQLYRFSDARQRAIFAAAPQRYAPALGGDCMVTFAETGIRSAGDLHYGLQHQQRLFFFAGPEQREQFRAEPARFVDADLAHQGHCIVSKMDRQQLIKGLPETVATVGGLRYLFLGSQQQAQFLTNLRHYGARIMVASTAENPASKQEISPPNLLVPGNQSGQPNLRGSELAAGSSRRNEGESAKKTGQIPTDAKAALAGYCPVSIRDNGTWEVGNARQQVMYDGKVYQFAGESEKALFTNDPAPYIPALAGNCIISLVKNNQQIAGSIYHTANYEGRLFLFVGADERLAFKADPTAYADTDLAMGGNCAVTQAEKGETVAGLPEHMTWYQGKRYYFVSSETKAKFLDDPKSYINPADAKKKPTPPSKIPLALN